LVDKLLKLDLACGKSKQPGFTGVDKFQLEGVDFIWDLEQFPYPWEDNSVDEIYCSHYVEHAHDLIKFMNEVHRILKVGGKCTVVAPYYASMRAWRDPTHVREINEMTFLYFNKEWREQNKVEHYLGITCDFDFNYGYNMAPDWAQRSEEARSFAIRHYLNVVNDIIVNLTKKEPPKPK